MTIRPALNRTARKWLHRAKVIFLHVPVKMLLMFVFFLTHIAEALCEFWTENKDFLDVIRSEWTGGWDQ